MQIEEDKKLKYVLTWTIVGLLLFIVIICTFAMGIFVGQKRAEFSFSWAQNYHQNFGGSTGGMMGNFPAMDFTNSHGVYGPVIKINESVMIIKDEDGIEKTVVASSQTTVRNNTGEIMFSTIKVGDNVVIIGEPNQWGQIDAKFIRVLPANVSSMFYRRHGIFLKFSGA